MTTMQVQITTQKISPELRQALVDHIGEDRVRAYRVLRIDMTQVPATLAQALEAASKVPDSGVSEFAPKNVGKPPQAPLVESKKPLVLDEGGQRLRYHVQVNGLLPGQKNVLAIKNWFERHPGERFDKDTVDRVVFREIEHELAWELDHPGHLYWVAKLNPPPPPAPAPPPPKPRTDWGKLPNGEKRLPIPVTVAELTKASFAQVEDYRDRLRRGES